MIYIGIDNGVSGSIGLIVNNKMNWFKTPVKRVLNYTKKKAWLNRIDFNALRKILLRWFTGDAKVLLERPMVNPTMFKATVSAVRALEATLIILEDLNYSYEYIDSKEWQKAMLPSGLKGTVELKKASTDVAHRLFPNLKFTGDGDGILIAEFARRKNETIR